MSQKEEYSPYKIVHHLDKIQQLKNGEQTVPLQLQIVPSNKCNQRCHFCAYRMKDYPSNAQFVEKDVLQYEKIIETLFCAQQMGVKGIQYTGGGEPTVHPRIYDMFKHTLAFDLELALVTNGQSLDEKTCDLLGDASWVRISVDSGSPRLYGLIRSVPEKTFDKVIKNIKVLVKYRRNSIIGMGFVVNRENYKEIYQGAKIAKDLGIDNFRISAAFTPMGYDYFKDFEQEARELAKKAEELRDENFTIFNLFNDRIKDCFEGVQDYDFCSMKELMVYIGADSNVYTCCTLAYNKKGYIGTIKDQSFETLWNSRQKIDYFKRHTPRKMCKVTCMYKNKNDFNNYCIKKDPKHVNFI